MFQAAFGVIMLASVLFAPPGAQSSRPRQRGAAQQPAAKPAAEAKLKRLVPEYDVWIDTEHKRVILTAEVVLGEGPLELFACLKGTKEHEAIVAVKTKAHVVHAALLAIGAEAGQAVSFRPEYRPATGTPIDVAITWKDAAGKDQSAKAQDWIRNAKTHKALDQSWVFAGSGFFENEVTHEKHYLAEDGDLICVSNFPSATLDLPIESSQSNEALMFECFAERIPPIGTKVTLTLTPQRKAKPPATVR